MTITYVKGLDVSNDTQLPNQTVTEIVNIRYVKHVTINDPLLPEEYATLAPRRPIRAESTDNVQEAE